MDHDRRLALAQARASIPRNSNYYYYVLLSYGAFSQIGFSFTLGMAFAPSHPYLGMNASWHLPNWGQIALLTGLRQFLPVCLQGSSFSHPNLALDSRASSELGWNSNQVPINV